MPRNSKIVKEPYNSPSLTVLDANAAKARLQADGNPQDPKTQKMLPLIEEQPTSPYWWHRDGRS